MTILYLLVFWLLCGVVNIGVYTIAQDAKIFPGYDPSGKEKTFCVLVGPIGSLAWVIVFTIMGVIQLFGGRGFK